MLLLESPKFCYELRCSQAFFRRRLPARILALLAHAAPQVQLKKLHLLD